MRCVAISARWVILEGYEIWGKDIDIRAGVKQEAFAKLKLEKRKNPLFLYLRINRKRTKSLMPCVRLG